MTESSPGDRAKLADRVAALEWYHTIEVAPGVVTPGWFDTREVAPQLPFPVLEGRRCLDVGTFDGFWAYEMERRGAREVIAIDILDPRGWDWPAGAPPEAFAGLAKRKQRGEGFEIAREALGSGVLRKERSVYELDPSEDGDFDLVYVGSLLLHLRDPVGALECVRAVCSGALMVVDAIDLPLTLTHPRRPMASLDALGRPWWWKPNLAALVRMVEAAGFEVMRRRRLFMPPGPGQGRTRPSLRNLVRGPSREALLRERLGDPHAALLARPR